MLHSLLAVVLFLSLCIAATDDGDEQSRLVELQKKWGNDVSQNLRTSQFDSLTGMAVRLLWHLHLRTLASRPMFSAAEYSL